MTDHGPYRNKPRLTDEQRDDLLVALVQATLSLAASAAQYEPIASANDARITLLVALRAAGIEPAPGPPQLHRCCGGLASENHLEDCSFANGDGS